MKIALERVILYVQDVKALAAFYVRHFELQLVEEIDGEWAVLQAGPGELALHRAGEAWRHDPGRVPVHSNAKIVFRIDRDLTTVRAELVARGVRMREIKSFHSTGPLCDGVDPEGNVFQLAQAAAPPS